MTTAYDLLLDIQIVFGHWSWSTDAEDKDDHHARTLEDGTPMEAVERGVSRGETAWRLQFWWISSSYLRKDPKSI